MELRDKEVEVRETGVPADDNYDVQDVEFLLAGGHVDDDCGC